MIVKFNGRKVEINARFRSFDDVAADGDMNYVDTDEELTTEEREKVLEENFDEINEECSINQGADAYDRAKDRMKYGE